MNKDEIKDLLDKLEQGELCTPNCYGCFGDGKLSFAYCPDVADNFEKELANLGYREVADDETVIKKSEYAELCMTEYEAINDAIEYEKQITNLKNAKQEAVRDFAKIIISAIWEEKKNEKIKIKDVHDTIRDVLRMHFGIELED